MWPDSLSQAKRVHLVAVTLGSSWYRQVSQLGAVRGGAPCVWGGRCQQLDLFAPAASALSLAQSEEGCREVPPS